MYANWCSPISLHTLMQYTPNAAQGYTNPYIAKARCRSPLMEDQLEVNIDLFI